MRILLVHDYGTRNGGAEVMMLAIRAALRERGHEALLFTSTAQPLPLPVLADATCFGTMSPPRRLLQACNPHARSRVAKVVKQFRPDVVHVKMFSTQLSPLVLAPLHAVPSLLHVINYDLVCPLNTKTLPDGAPCHDRPGAVCHANGCMPWLGVARAALQRRLTDLDGFDQIVANSRWIAERLRREDVRVDRVVPNGVAPRPRRGPLGRPPVVGFAGRLVHKKGADVLLHAMREVCRTRPDARLVVAGDGPERRPLGLLAADLGIANAVDFLGHLEGPDLERALAPAWVQAVPSRWQEPFGLVAAEAMLRGTAVVASRDGGLAEQVVEGETGYLVASGDPPALARALLRVLGDRDLADRLGDAGYRRGLAELTLERHADRLIAIYEELVASPRVSRRASAQT